MDDATIDEQAPMNDRGPRHTKNNYDKHFKVMARAIVKKRGVLTLPGDTRNFLLEHLDDGARAVADDIESRLEERDETWEQSGHQDDTYPVEQILADLDILRTVPGGISRTSIILNRVLDRELKCAGLNMFEMDFYRSARLFDDFGLKLVMQMLQQQHLTQRIHEINDMRKPMVALRQSVSTDCQKFEKVWMENSMRLPDHILFLGYNLVYDKSIKLIHAWHSREAGKMSAMKVAGDMLPPELVVLIAEGFYDCYDGETLEMFDSSIMAKGKSRARTEE